MGVVKESDPCSLNFKALDHTSGITEARFVKFLIQVGYIKCYQKDDTPPPKWAWLWSRDSFEILPFAVMQRVARFCQRPLILALKCTHIKNRRI